MEIKKEGAFYSSLFNWFGGRDRFDEVLYFVEHDDISRAYEVAYEIGKTQMPRELTMYLMKEHCSPLKYDPLLHMESVPACYLFEGVDKELVVYVNDNIKEIKENAFAYCSIKKLIISKSVESLGDNSLCLNDGEICYEGTKQEFISKFLGKTKCFFRSHKQQSVNCSDGVLII